MPETGALEVVIAGGGVAALEAAFALHELAGDRVNLTLVASAADFVYQPMALLEPFASRSPRHLPLTTIATRLNATLVRDTLAAVDWEHQVLRTGAERELRYDALVIAVGARTSNVLEGAVAIDITRMRESLHALIEEIDSGLVHRLAIVAPSPTWPLPAYELALLIRERARERNIDLTVTIITSEQRPLAVFGERVSADVAWVLADAGIRTVVDARAESSSGELIVHAGEHQSPSHKVVAALRFDRVAALPRLVGPAISGLPADAEGFIPVSSHGEVTGVKRVYAAGDATDFPIKHGGIAAQQADAVAAAVAALAGAPIEPAPFAGDVHGFLMRGRRQPRLYYAARIEGGLARDSRTSDTPTSSPEAKIDARYLAPYLDELWAAPATRLWRLARKRVSASTAAPRGVAIAAPILLLAAWFLSRHACEARGKRRQRP